MSARPRALAGMTQVDPARTAAGTPPLASHRRATSDQRGPTLVEVADESMFYVDAIVIGAVVKPGFLLCVPGLRFVVVPVVAIGLLAAAAGLVILLAVVPLRAGWQVARRPRRGLAPGVRLGYDGAPARAARREDHRAPQDAVEALDR